MPWECDSLKNEPFPLIDCPWCGAYPLKPFIRGQVHRSKRKFTILWWKSWLPLPWLVSQPYCAVICSRCHQIVDFESPKRKGG